MILLFESVVLCLVFTLMVYIMSREPIKTLYNYPPKIQERVKSLEEYKDKMERRDNMWTCPKCGKVLTREDQHHFCIKPETIDEYISQQADSVQPRLQAIRETIHAAIPEAQEKISWQMPTFWMGRNIIQFMAAKKHIGLYPGGEATEAFAERLADIDTSKGTIRLPHSRELPLELIRDIAIWCYEKYAKV